MKLLIEEPGSTVARRVWEASARAVCSWLLYPEARAALAAATRAGRVEDDEHVRARELMERLWRETDRLGLRTALARRAGDLAEQHALRGYDAVHLACFETLAEEAILVTFDDDLRRAARASGFALAPASL